MNLAVPEELTEAQRLALAAAVAPSIRRGSEVTKARRVTLYDPETGKVTGYSTLAEVQAALLREREIELAVIDGVRPKEVVCPNCGKTIRIGPVGRLPITCIGGCDLRCSSDECRNKINPQTARINARQGKPNVCRKCVCGVARPLPTCSDCAGTLTRTADWQHRIRLGSTEPLRCASCARKARKLKPRPTCSCGKGLSRDALRSARVKSGKQPMCSDCYRGEARRTIVLEKMATDPVFATKVKLALKKGQGHNRKEAP